MTNHTANHSGAARTPESRAARTDAVTINRAGSNATRKLARHAAGLAYEQLPPALVEMTKLCVLDTLGVCIGASTLAPEAALVADFVREYRVDQGSTLLGFGERTPAPWAAFVNGSLGHMLDYDDVGGGHVSIATIPVAFALGEKRGGLSGRELITAVAAGSDLMTRFCLSIDVPDWQMNAGWFATQLFGFLGGAATAGHVLGLDAVQMENALGIAFNQMSGSRQMAVGAATHMRSMQAGFSGQGAVIAAELAWRGIIGPKDIVEGPYGVFRNYIRTESPYWDALLGDLGTRFPLLDTHGFKVWPACGYTRATNAAILHLRQQHALQPEDVEAITVVGGNLATQQLCEPLDRKRRPQVSIDGKFSIPFTSAVMMARGNVTLRDYTPEGLRDPAVLAMADKVNYRAENMVSVHAAGDYSSASKPIVEIRMRDGRMYSYRADRVPGDAKHPIEPESLKAKFRDCVSFSAKPIPPANVERAIKLIATLENLPDAR
ncbi:MAG: MmgE/PrpD family protein, partial [Burkholderiales bacterium]|nr:MmgE/PrpD family protein [Burkholderiales bacterium]